MSQKLKLSVVTPQKQLISEEVDQVNAPGSEGDFGILYDLSLIHISEPTRPY